jgi:8-oxo-dGTP pyrophosphatase MutT (NUDIX family)
VPENYLNYLRDRAETELSNGNRHTKTGKFVTEKEATSGVHVWLNTNQTIRPIAAGLAIVAGDTGRIILLQRALTPEDPAAGKWEFPGGTLEPNETPYEAAQREWTEETGHKIPAGTLVNNWISPNNVYQGFIYLIPKEDFVTLNLDHEDRHVLNPDDPDGDEIETIAWWSLEDLQGNTALRDEMLNTPWDLLRQEQPTPTKPQLADRVETTLTKHYEFYNKCHSEKTGKFCEENRGGQTRKVLIEKASAAEKKEAKRKALAKIRIAPVPPEEEVLQAREEIRRANTEGKRQGGESRGGSAEDRRKQAFNLFKEFGGVKRGYIVDHQSGIKLHYTADPAINPNQYPLLERGKIFTKEQGGGYQLTNLIPESLPTNRARGSRPVRKENL